MTAGRHICAQSLFVLVLLIIIMPTVLLGQSGVCCDLSYLELLQTERVSMEFFKSQEDYRIAQMEERRRVPVYNARLNNAVADFHKHITKDSHYLVTNCAICRKYLSEIKCIRRR